MKKPFSVRPMLVVSTAFARVTALTALALAIGCASRGYQQHNRASSGAESAALRVEGSALRFDNALAALNDLIQRPATDLRPQFERLSSELKAAEALPQAIDSADKALQSQGDTYFATWDRELTQIQDEVILAKSRARKLEVLSTFNDARRHCGEVRAQLAPVIADLKDARKFLEADLTASGRATLSSETTRIANEAAPVRQSVAKLVTELRTLAAATSSKSAPAAESPK